MAHLSLLGMSPEQLDWPGNFLRFPAKDVDFSTIGPDTLKRIIHDLFYVMYSKDDGVGLAAPMVGVNLKIIIADIDGHSPSVLINPELIESSKEKVEIKEANLCLPWVVGKVKRPKTLTVRAYNPEGNVEEKTYSDLLARVIWHELDLLEGKIFCDFVPKGKLVVSSPEKLAQQAMVKIYGDEVLKEQKGEDSMHYLSPVTLSSQMLDAPHSMLRQKCAPVDFKEWKPEQLRWLIGEMIWLQHHLEGVGIAAPQVGFSIRLSAIDYQPGKKPPLVIINPEITHLSEEKKEGIEACLSLPGYSGPVERSTGISLKFYNPLGKQEELVLEPSTETNESERQVKEYLARIIQHEIDHLDGILYPDRMKDLSNLKSGDPDILAKNAINSIYSGQ